MKAVVLAAGEGVRMRPLTLTRSKHMIPLAGKPIIDYVFQAIRKNGIRETLVIVGYRRALIQEFFGDGSKSGLDLSYVSQEGILGTADAVGLAEEYVEKEDFLLVYGDLLIDPLVIRSVIQAHKRKRLTTLAVASVEDPERYGVVNLEDDLVAEIVEKPRPEEVDSNLANAGIYIFTSEVFSEVKKTRKSSRLEFEITDTIRLLIQRGVPVAPVVISSEEWMDIGRPWDLLEASKRVLQHTKLELKGEIEDGAHIAGPVGLAEGAKIRSGAYIEGPTFIGEGSCIGPNCYVRPFTSIGKSVHVGNACEIKNSVILDKTQIGHLSYVGDSVIGENCNLGAGTITGNLRLDEKSVRVMVKDELVDSGRKKLGVIMGDSVKTAINVNFMPGVKIGQDVWIGPNVTVYRDVPSATLVTRKQELEHRKTPE